MESCNLLFSWIRSLISESILHAGCSQQCLPKFLAGVSHRDTEISYLSTPWHAWALSADIPVDWILCLTHPSLHPFMPWKASWSGLRIFYSTEIPLVNWLIDHLYIALFLYKGCGLCTWADSLHLFHFLSGLHLWRSLGPQHSQLWVGTGQGWKVPDDWWFLNTQPQNMWLHCERFQSCRLVVTLQITFESCNVHCPLLVY